MQTAACLVSCMVLVPYRVLIEITITTIAGPTLLFLTSFVVLRVARPELPRPYKLPGGTIAAAIYAAPPAVFTVVQLVFALTGTGEEEYVEKEPDPAAGGGGASGDSGGPKGMLFSIEPNLLVGLIMTEATVQLPSCSRLGERLRRCRHALKLPCHK
jgi:hypothetical protein